MSFNIKFQYSRQILRRRTMQKRQAKQKEMKRIIYLKTRIQLGEEFALQPSDFQSYPLDIPYLHGSGNQQRTHQEENLHSIISCLIQIENKEVIKSKMKVELKIDANIPLRYKPGDILKQHRMKLVRVNSQPYLLTMGAKRNECYVIELFHQGRAEIIQKIRTRKPIIDIGVYHNNDLNGLLNSLVVLQTEQTSLFYEGHQPLNHYKFKNKKQQKRRKILFRSIKKVTHKGGKLFCAIKEGNKVATYGVISKELIFSSFPLSGDSRQQIKINLQRLIDSSGIPNNIKLGDIEILISIEETNKKGQLATRKYVVSFANGGVGLFQPSGDKVQYNWAFPFADEEKGGVFENISCSFMKIANVQINKNGSKFIKPLIIVGSKRSSSVYILDQTTLEIIYEYKLPEKDGQDIRVHYVETLGDPTIQNSTFINAQYMCLAGTDNVISIISLNKLTEYLSKQNGKKQIHECEQITVGTTDTIKIPEEERIMSMSADFVIGNTKQFTLIVLSLTSREEDFQNVTSASTSDSDVLYLQRIRKYQIDFL